MPKIKLPDLSGVEDVGEFNDVPKGLYVMKIREQSESETGESSKFPGQPMATWVMDPVRIVGGAKIKKGEYQGLFHRFPLDDQNPGWTPRLKEAVKAVPNAVKKGVLDSNAVEGTLLIVKVKDGKDQSGERRAEVDRIMPYTEESAGASDDDDDDVTEEELWEREELEELSATDLKDAAEELEVEVPAGKLTSAKKKKLIDAILEAQEGDEDEDEDEEDDDEEDGDDDEYTAEDLDAMSKDELAEAAGEFEVEFPNRLTAAARKRVVTAILEAQGGEEDDEDEDEDGEDEDGYTQEDLEALSAEDLKEVASEFEVPVPKGKLIAAKKKKLIDAILEAQEEADEEDEDDDDDDDEDEEDDGYDEMSKTELAKEARSRSIKVRKGMSQEAIIEALREHDAENEEEDEDEDEDDDDEMDPESMDLDEIKVALKERGISTKGSEKVLRNKLTKALEADDDGDPF